MSATPDQDTMRPGTMRRGTMRRGATDQLGWSVGLADVTLAVQVVNPAGQATALLIHGWGSNRQVWDRMIACADPRLRLVLVDLRGHGQSSRARSPHTIDGMADDIEQLLDRLNPAPVIVLGHSMGGNVAVEVAVRRPGLFAGICCIDPAYDDPGWADAGNRIAELRHRGTKAALDSLPTAFGPDAAPQLIESAADALRSTPADVLIEGLRSTYLNERAFGHRQQTHEKLRQLHVPTLSVYTTAERADLARQFPLSQHTVVTIDGSGHFIPLEQPTKLWEAVTAWLGTLP